MFILKVRFVRAIPPWTRRGARDSRFPISEGNLEASRRLRVEQGSARESPNKLFLSGRPAFRDPQRKKVTIRDREAP